MKMNDMIIDKNIFLMVFVFSSIKVTIFTLHMFECFWNEKKEVFSCFVWSLIKARERKKIFFSMEGDRLNMMLLMMMQKKKKKKNSVL